MSSAASAEPVVPPESQIWIDRIRGRCHGAGLDLVFPFRSEVGNLHLLIANSRALWAALDQLDPTADRPIDEHVERTVAAATAGLPCTVHYAHVEPFIPIQRIAHEAGFAYLAQTHLSIHPTFGPWFGLRAVVDTRIPHSKANTPVENPCRTCRCGPVLADANAHPDDWQRRLAVRDHCSVGSDHRYSEAQIGYHYTKDRTYLTPTPSDPTRRYLTPPDPGE